MHALSHPWLCYAGCTYAQEHGIGNQSMPHSNLPCIRMNNVMQRIMQVLLLTGWTYERSAIETWLQSHDTVGSFSNDQ